MNEHNHHRVIKEGTKRMTIGDPKILEDASDFTDDFMGTSKINLQTGSESKFYYFHFYYDIICDCDNGTIKLSRNNQNSEGWGKSYERCELGMIRSNFEKSVIVTNHNGIVTQRTEKNYKKFYTFINERMRYYQENDPLDNSNQSDCVAFLHAMGAKEEKKNESREEFEKHLRKCFSEYLFLKNEKEALFVLGIALHGIMDSFTPSHTDFQKYTDQDMAYHAQGDVIPFENHEDFMKNGGIESDSVHFIPGQFCKESPIGKMAFAIFKHYNNDDHLNDTEYKMLLIFLIICDLDLKDPDIKALFNGSYNLSYERVVGKNNYHEPRSKKVLNTLLSKKRYGANAFLYSNTAITTVVSIFNELHKGRLLCKSKGYDYYKEKKETYIETALNCWRSNYDALYKNDEFLRRQNLLNHFFLKEPTRGA